MTGKEITSTHPTQQMVELGKLLRSRRQEAKLSLSDAAVRSELSPSFISLVENAKTDITIGRMNRLLSIYGMTIHDIYSPNRRLESSDLRSITTSIFESSEEGVKFQIFDDVDEFIPIRVIIEPYGRWREPTMHELSEHDFVVKGSIWVTIGTVSRKFNQGDSIYIPPLISHEFRNIESTTAELFVILRN